MRTQQTCRPESQRSPQMNAIGTFRCGLKSVLKPLLPPTHLLPPSHGPPPPHRSFLPSLYWTPPPWALGPSLPPPPVSQSVAPSSLFSSRPHTQHVQYVQLDALFSKVGIKKTCLPHLLFTPPPGNPTPVPLHSHTPLPSPARPLTPPPPPPPKKPLRPSP